MRKSLCVSVLVLVLCGSAAAGDISSPPAPTPNSISDTSFAAEETSSLSGGTQSGETQSADDPTAYLFAEAALTVLDSVLALF